MRVALIGNQNSGKTTLFNALTGSNQKIGNWPGVTIEQKVGTFLGNHELIDLPGIYSLSPYTVEEALSRAFLLQEKPDLIINIIDATSIERSLYLTTQLMELDIDMVIALNMADMFDKKGIAIDTKALSTQLNLSVVKISALKKSGLQELLNLIETKGYIKHQNLSIFKPNIEKIIQHLVSQMKQDHARFIAIKLLEKDPIIEPHGLDIDKWITPLEQSYKQDIETIIASGRYDYIEKVKSQTFVRLHHGDQTTEFLDRIFLNKWLALPIFGLIMFLIYYLSVGVIGTLTVDFIDQNVSSFSSFMYEWLQSIGASPWSASLVADGMIAGVGAVLNFVPQLIILFILISLLESTGYMTRIAFFLDRLFKRFGLSGKSLIPFILGSGCSIPGIMATRTIEAQEERRMSIMLTPFIPCSAKLPIIALFAGFFFPKYAGFVSFSLYMLAIIIILLSAIIMKTFFFKGSPSAFISELPNYKLPDIKYTLRDVYDKIFEFIEKAGTIILMSSIVIWFLTSFSFNLSYGVDVNQSILSYIGRVFSFIFYPMLGELSWATSVSAIQGLVAKEQVVSSMAIIGGLSADITEGNIILNAPIYAFFTPASAYAFMAFNLFSAPCFGAIAAMRKELGSARKMWQAILFQTGLAYLLGIIIYHSFTFIGGFL